MKAPNVRVTPAMVNVMVSLSGGERHGYSIMTDVEGFTGGATTLGPGTLYGAIKRMLGAGLIEESAWRPDPELDDDRRRYYRLTGLGRRVLDDRLTEMQQTVDVARRRTIPEVAT